jgi:nucleoside-diphosphate-sugar epimerase
MKVLITGATGFIGREIAYFLKNKYDVYVLVRKTSNISKIDLSDLTILQYGEYSELMDIFTKYKFDGVIHMASCVTIEHTKDQIFSLIDSNILFGTHLLEASKVTSVHWFLNTGTFWQHYHNESYNPINLYAATKKAFEDMAKFYVNSSNLIFTTIKLNDTFGPNDTRDKIFNLWLKISKSRETLNMSEGEQVIDISYIDDVVSAYATMVENLKEDNSIQYNNKSFVVTNNERLTLRELSHTFEEVTGESLPINWGARKYRERESMEPYSSGEVVPNWEQKITLKEAIRKVVQNIQITEE